MIINSFTNYPIVKRNSFRGFSEAGKNCAEKLVTGIEKKVDTSAQIARLIFEMKTGEKFVPQKVSEPSSVNKIGIISSSIKDLLEEVSTLFKSVNKEFLLLSGAEISKLRKEYPKFAKQRLDVSISFSRVNNKGLGLTYIDNVHDSSQDKIRVLCVRDSKNNIIDVIPFQEDKILKVRKNFEISKFANPLKYISKDEFLTQEEIDSKNIDILLNALKKELKNIYELSAYGGGGIDDNLADDLLKVESEIARIKKQIAIKKVRTANVKINKNGSIEFSNINDKGDKLYWYPSNKNNKLANTTIINLLSKDDKFIDGIAINDERILCNYPLEHKDSYPKNPRFYTTEEIQKLSLEDKLEKFISYFDVGKNAFDKQIKALLEIREKTKNIF